MKEYLIIGNGVAGTTAAQEIRKHDGQGRITMVTEEAIPFYSRIRLPDYVAGIAEFPDLVIRKTQWYEDHKIDLKTGVTIININHADRQATDQNGNVWRYDRLLIASGSRSFIPPVPGSTLKHVFALRTADDAQAMVAAAAPGKSAVVIGGGLLGLEAAHALIKRGLNVLVVEFADRLLPRQMDAKGAVLLKEMLEKQGFEFRLDAKTRKITGDTAATGVELESGEVLDAGMVLFSTGVRSNLDLPSKLGLETDRGVVVNSRMETSVAGIYAAGDVAQFEQINFCIWPEAQEQGRVAGANMAGGVVNFETIIPSNRLKVAGIDLGSAGEIDPEDRLDSEIEKSDGVYRKMVRKEGKLVGCIMLGNTDGFSSVVKQISGS